MALDAKDRGTHRLGGASFSIQNRAARGLWNFVWFLFAAWTPAPFHKWRIFLLSVFGASVHPTAKVYGSTKIWLPRNLKMAEYSTLGPEVNCYCMDLISLGKYAIVSQGAHLCSGTHDISDPDFQLITQPILIESNAWIAAGAFIGPGVKVHDGAVIGARAVMFRDAEPYAVYIGNPAQLVKRRELRKSSGS